MWPPTTRRASRREPSGEPVQERGFEHERRYLDDLRAAGRTIVEIHTDGSTANTRDGLREATAQTMAAMRAGADVVWSPGSSFDVSIGAETLAGGDARGRNLVERGDIRSITIVDFGRHDET